VSRTLSLPGWIFFTEFTFCDETKHIHRNYFDRLAVRRPHT
jgi:hypothetical protein